MLKKLIIFMGLFIASPALAGNLCGGGIICQAINTQFTHANAPVSTTLTIFTCNSTTIGCLVPAVFLYGNMTGAVNNTVTVSMVQGGISARMLSAYPQPFTALNILVNDANAFPLPLPNPPVDGNGNPIVFMSAGSSLTLTTSIGITASGAQSGTFDVIVYAQQF